MMIRAMLASCFLLLLAWAERPAESALLEIATEPLMPARIYIMKQGNAEFRLAPADAVLPIKSDLYYRDPLYMRSPDPKLLEVVARDQFHYLMLKGMASVPLPPGKYTIEAYRGLFYTPVRMEFELKANETRKLTLPLKPWAGVNPQEWISSDDHIHLTRGRSDDNVFLGWLEAEDLTVANFLQLQRQMDAAPQYGFGRAGEARRNGYSIRSGEELRNEFWGHVNILGNERMIRPMSTGLMYANTPSSYPYPALLFEQGRKLGGITGYAHFFQRPQNSSIYMDAVLGNIDFVEVMQFGVLKHEAWYELLNAGIRATGVAGSDFPVHLNNRNPWPHWLPLIGPERTLVKAKPGENSFASWARGVKEGRAIVSNGPIVELEVNPNTGEANAKAAFYRPIEALEIVRNGIVIASARANKVNVVADCPQSCWLAARVRVEKLAGEPEIQAHTNPVYLLRDGKPVKVEAARKAVAAKWEEQLNVFRAANIVFPDDVKKREFFALADRALAELRR